MNNTGIIFNVQRFSLHDGPGIRTTVFLKGCPLNCVWCHNPESKLMKPQLAFAETRCICCGRCEVICPNGVHGHGDSGKIVLFEKCIACGKCTETCPAMALEIMGKAAAAAEVIDEVKRDIPFYKSSGGGMTVSGGEPAMQPAFTLELLKRAKELDIHTAIETAGFADWSVYESFLPYLDMVLIDSKQMDTEKHHLYTGVSNDKIHDNLQKFCDESLTVEVVVRTPVIPAYNDDSKNFYALSNFLHTLSRTPRVEVLPYNPLAGSKHPRLGMEYLPIIEDGQGTSPEVLCRILTENGITAKVVK